MHCVPLLGSCEATATAPGKMMTSSTTPTFPLAIVWRERASQTSHPVPVPPPGSIPFHRASQPRSLTGRQSLCLGSRNYPRP